VAIGIGFSLFSKKVENMMVPNSMSSSDCLQSVDSYLSVTVSGMKKDFDIFITKDEQQ